MTVQLLMLKSTLRWSSVCNCMKMELVVWRVAVASLLLFGAPAVGSIPVCREALETGSDVQLAINCSTHDHKPELVYVYTGTDPEPSEFDLFGTISIEYTCTNSSDAELVDDVLITNAPSPTKTRKLPSTYTDGVQCTFSGCYMLILNNFMVITRAIQPTPCTVDLDECALGMDNCDENAVCNNTIGSFECQCKAGYEGNGTHCKDVDECTSGTHNCTENANCMDAQGSYYCECAPGFQGDGTTNCTDIDECKTGIHNCSDDAECANMEGGYTCSCNTGFAGSGFECTSEGPRTSSAVVNPTPDHSGPPVTSSAVVNPTPDHSGPPVTSSAVVNPTPDHSGPPVTSSAVVNPTPDHSGPPVTSSAVVNPTPDHSGPPVTSSAVVNPTPDHSGPPVTLSHTQLIPSPSISISNFTKQGSEMSWLYVVSFVTPLLIVSGAAVGFILLLYARKKKLSMHKNYYPSHFTSLDWNEVDTEIELVKPDGILPAPTPTESIFDMLEYSTPTQNLTEVSEPEETINDSKSSVFSGTFSGSSSESLQADKERHWNVESSNASCDRRLMSDSTHCVDLEADSHQEQTQLSLTDVKESEDTVLSPTLSNFQTTLQQLDASCLLDSEGYIDILPMENTSRNIIKMTTYPRTVEFGQSRVRLLCPEGVTSDDEDYVTPTEGSTAKATETPV